MTIARRHRKGDFFMLAREPQSQATQKIGNQFDAQTRNALILQNRPEPRLTDRELQRLPDPVFPQYPEFLGDLELDSRYVPSNGNPYCMRITPFILRRALPGWLYPYVKSRVLPGEFHPIIAYLFTEWKCNLDCHYCWAFNNKVHGMTEDVARRSIDWLHDTGCRVLALMGGRCCCGRSSCTRSFTMP
jgi:sulfatase maturation enzyme AslB (radical SAM superfamily)